MRLFLALAPPRASISCLGDSVRAAAKGEQTSCSRTESGRSYSFWGEEAFLVGTMMAPVSAADGRPAVELNQREGSQTVANWPTINQYLTSNYKTSAYGDGPKLFFDLGDGRSLMILGQWAGQSAETAKWGDFQSPIGRIAEIDMARAIRMTEQYVLGGISIQGELATLRTSVPLENLDQNESEEPLDLLLSVADQLESELTGADVF